ncbi:MAG: LytR family transcriptional regulator [Chloroflexi bacterium]|nr:LytR family transcriptional regulator [Chloroflexota bacterium]
MDTVPSHPPKRTRNKKTSGLGFLVFALAALVGLNVCLTFAFIGYYAVYRSRALAANETPAPPLEVLRTIVPALPNAESTLTPTPAPSATPIPATGIVNILLLGKDERPDQAGDPTRTDTMMLLRADFDHHTAKLLALPRDMWVALPNFEAYGITEGRINTAYYYGEVYDVPGGGPRSAMDAVTLNFGVPLDHYAIVNFQGFVNIVDALGGIDIDVPERIYDSCFPTDNYGCITLVVEPGYQHMDGLAALRYARTRHQDGDTERVKRQQLVLLAIRDRALSFDAVTKIPEVYAAAEGTFDTDMTLPTLISYGLEAQRIERSQIQTYVIDQNMLASWVTPGGASVWIPQRARIAPVIEAFLATP